MTTRDKIEIYAAVIAGAGAVKATKVEIDKVLDRADMFIAEIEQRMNPDNEPEIKQ